MSDGRGAQPRIGSRVAWREPIHVHDFRRLERIARRLHAENYIPGPCSAGIAAATATVTPRLVSYADFCIFLALLTYCRGEGPWRPAGPQPVCHLFHATDRDLRAEQAKCRAVLVRRRASEALRPKVAQDLDVRGLPLFSDQAGQLDLVDAVRPGR